MEATLIDDLARKLGRQVGRRRMMAALFAGAGATAIGGLLRPRAVAAAPWCGNCDSICDRCFEGNRAACNVCGHCARGYCTDCHTNTGECVSGPTIP
jgi:hypothetical protein